MNLNRKGLSSTEVLASRKKHGPNSLNLKRKHPILVLASEIVFEPMFILLSVTSLIYFVLGETNEGIMLLVALSFVTGISIFQSARSRSATKALGQISASKAKVYRNGVSEEINQTEVVVGDCLLVEEGDMIPADAIITESFDFSVNESMLTGESFSVSKSSGGIFAGTMVVSGSAVGVVSKVGREGAIGQLGSSMQRIEGSKTLLQKQIDRFVRGMALFGVIAFAIVWFINYTASGQMLESLIIGLTLAMSALPEEIPVAFSTFMALGAWRLLRKNVLTKQPQTVESLGAASIICLDKTGTITENKMELEYIYIYGDLEATPFKECINPACKQVLEDAYISSELTPFDPMEIAIHSAYLANAAHQQLGRAEMIHEYPLEGTPPMMTHVFEIDGIVKVAAKGGWERIASVCRLSTSEIVTIKKQVEKLAHEGMRVLGTAHAIFDSSLNFPKNQNDFSWQFSGLVSFSDPPKKNIREVFSKFYQAGVEIKMITGDYSETALAIARQSGLRNTGKVITGTEVMEMDDQQLSVELKRTDVFARMFPEAKLRIINKLKEMGEVVAMTGDGVNDGPALKAADIGIAMGKRGTEIARVAAKMILVDDNLEKMVDAIEAGRKIYDNLKKAFRYIISIHIPIILVVTIPLVLGWKYPNIFTPIHVIFLELIMGPTCSIIYENEPAEPGIMEKGPRRINESLFSWPELSLSILQGLIISLGVLAVYQYCITQNSDLSTTRTWCFTTLIFSNIILTLANRSFTRSIFVTLLYKNYLIPIIIFITLALWWAAVNIPMIQSLFGFSKIDLSDILLCAVVGSVSVLWLEIYKMFKRKN